MGNNVTQMLDNFRIYEKVKMYQEKKNSNKETPFIVFRMWNVGGDTLNEPSYTPWFEEEGL